MKPSPNSTICLPRMRGDRPWIRQKYTVNEWFTPHARGSTLCFRVFHLSIRVYPACAGIDRASGSDCKIVNRLPRMRGDRPLTPRVLAWKIPFTPHARGSTVLLNNGMSRQEVYPACAGIDPKPDFQCIFQECLPRMRGDRPLLDRFFRKAAGFTPHARGSTCMVTC